MACCAIAFFLVSQILWPVRWLRAHVFVNVRNRAVDWSPSNSAYEPTPRRALASTVTLVVAAAFMLASFAEAAQHSDICSVYDSLGN